MADRILWLGAMLIAALALVAGCVKVDVPQGPYVTIREQPRTPTPQDQARVHAMDKAALENEVLRLAGENDSLRQDCEKLKRENKSLKKDNEQLKDEIKDLRKH